MSEREDLLRLVEADLDGEIVPADRARLAAALHDDPTLAAEAAELRRLRALFRAVPAASAPAELRSSVLAAVTGAEATASQRRAGFRLVGALPWIAGLAAAALLTVLLAPWSPRNAVPEATTAVETADLPDARALDRAAPPEHYAEPAPEPVATAEAPPPAPAKSLEPAARSVAETREKAREDTEGGGGGGGGAAAEDLARESGALAEAEGASPGPPGTAPSSPVAGGKAKVGRGRPAAEPVVPAADTGASAPVDPADGSADATSRAARPSDALKDARPPARRYVVFEDEEAARRFLAALQPRAETKSEESAQDDEAPAEATRTAAERARTGRRAIGGEQPLGSGAGFFAAEPPRVIGRVALATTDPVVGRVFARAPAGGIFGEHVPAELLELAEARFERARDGKLASTPQRAEQEPGEEADELRDDHSAGDAGDAGGGDAGEVARPAAPKPAEPELTAEGGNGAEPGRIEIVVVVVPRGTLPPAAGADDGDR